MEDKPWLDVGMLAVARMALGDSIPALMEHLEDRSDFRLRWICHLDQYGGGGLEHLWEKQLGQIVSLSALFDDFLLIASRSHVGYGGGLLRILKEVRHGMLYLDDDHVFHTEINVSEAIGSGCDYYNWHNAPPGATVPSYWSMSFAEYMASHFPYVPREVTERNLIYLAATGGATSNRDPTLTSANSRKLHKGRSTNIGSECVRRCGAVKYTPNSQCADEAGVVRRKRGWSVLSKGVGYPNWIKSVAGLIARRLPAHFLELNIGDGETARNLYFHARESNKDHYVGIGTWDGSDSAERESRARANIGLSWQGRHGHIEVGPCLTILAKLCSNPRHRNMFDLIVVDGPRPCPKEDLLAHSMAAWPLLKHTGGIMIWPNSARDQISEFTDSIAGSYTEVLRSIGQYAIRRTDGVGQWRPRRRR